MPDAALAFLSPWSEGGHSRDEPKASARGSYQSQRSVREFDLSRTRRVTTCRLCTTLEHTVGIGVKMLATSLLAMLTVLAVYTAFLALAPLALTLLRRVRLWLKKELS